MRWFPEGRKSVKGGPPLGRRSEPLTDFLPSNTMRPEGKGAGSQGACPLAEFEAAPQARRFCAPSSPGCLPHSLFSILLALSSRACAVCFPPSTLSSVAAFTRPASMRIRAVFYNSVQDGVLHSVFQGRCHLSDGLDSDQDAKRSHPWNPAIQQLVLFPSGGSPFRSPASCFPISPTS